MFIKHSVGYWNSIVKLIYDSEKCNLCSMRKGRAVYVSMT